MRRRAGCAADGGFTMIEVIVALALITTIMGSVGAYFVNGIKTSRKQAQIQAAERLIQTSMEQARGYGGPTLLVGRVACGSCASVAAYDGGLLSNTVRWDAPTSAATPTVPLPNVGELVQLNGINYFRYWLVGKCGINTDGSCGADLTRPVVMVRLVIGLTWTEPSCAGGFCIRAGTALFSSSPIDPVFGP